MSQILKNLLCKAVKYEAMKRVLLLFILLIISLAIFFYKSTPIKLDAQWVVIGAGPAGIAVIGILTDNDVDPQSIIWIDPEFNVGRLGKYYTNVPGNARARSYVEFITGCTIFQINSPAIDNLLALPCNIVPTLKAIIDPLQDITKHIRTKVRSIQGTMTDLSFRRSYWQIIMDGRVIQSKNVVLATGSHPKEIHYNSVQTVPLDHALDQQLLNSLVLEDDMVGVIGSAHSALLVLRYLTEIKLKYIINFYKHPIVFPTKVHGQLAWSEVGIKGDLAKWVKEVMQPRPPRNLIRISNAGEEVLKQLVPQMCTKIIIASGYERNELPQGINYAGYNSSTGLIAPHLYGVGIAFPEKKKDALGNIEWSVGVLQFMHYLQRIVPQWLTYYRD